MVWLYIDQHFDKTGKRLLRSGLSRNQFTTLVTDSNSSSSVYGITDLTLDSNPSVYNWIDCLFITLVKKKTQNTKHSISVIVKYGICTEFAISLHCNLQCDLKIMNRLIKLVLVTWEILPQHFFTNPDSEYNNNNTFVNVFTYSA